MAHPILTPKRAIGSAMIRRFIVPAVFNHLYVWSADYLVNE
jgi:hypothetical protein